MNTRLFLPIVLLAISGLLTSGTHMALGQSEFRDDQLTLAPEAIASLTTLTGVDLPAQSSLEAEMARQNDFATLATRLDEEYPSDFAGAYILADSTFELRFAGAAPEAAISTVTATSMEISIVEWTGISAQELSRITEILHFAIYEQVGRGVATSPNAREGSITIFVPDERLDVARSAFQVALSQVGSSASGLKITLTSEGGGASGEDAIYGGGILTSCTSGFSVQNSLYPNALMTAAHCGNSQTYTGGIALSFRAESSTRDVQWHSSSSQTASPSFYSNSGVLSFVGGKANPVVGQTLCKYGKTTGRTCDTTYLDDQCRDSYCDMMTMTHRYASGGDSGGPWFSGNTAYGIHSGWVTIWLAERDMFTPINSGLTALSLGLKTT